MNDDTSPHPEQPERPLGYWLRAVDGLLSQRFADAFAESGVTRREWMVLNVLAGAVDAPGFAERIARKGKRLRGLVERGWIAIDDDAVTLTDEGRAAQERLSGLVADIRSEVAGATSPEDYATTIATLEAIARQLGWNEADTRGAGGFGRWARGPRFGPGPRGGFGPGGGFGLGGGFGPGFGPGFGRGPRHAGHGRGDHPGCDRHGHTEHGHGGRHAHPGHPRHHGHGHGRRRAERAYERGFEAGYSRGRDNREG